MEFMVKFVSEKSSPVTINSCHYGLKLLDDILDKYSDIVTDYKTLDSFVSNFVYEPELRFHLFEAEKIKPFLNTCQLEVCVPEGSLNKFMFLEVRDDLCGDDYLDMTCFCHYVLDDANLKRLWHNYGYDLEITTEEINEFLAED